MSDPLEPPANAVAEAREVLHAVLVATFARCGWSRERATAYFPGSITPPCGWIDAATVSRQGAGVIATFPIVLAVDGTDRGQLRRLDAAQAAGWELLSAARLPNGSLIDLLTVGPQDIDLGGISTRGVVFSAQVGIAARTLCPTALTASDDTP
jgi:hypothetical protein